MTPDALARHAEASVILRRRALLASAEPSAEMPRRQRARILQEIRRRGPCHVLVFGAGSDTADIVRVNRHGSVTVLEDDRNWAEEAKHAGAICHVVNYGTRVDGGVLDECPPLQVPQSVLDGRYDVIVIDGPKGGEPSHPGRQQAAQLAAKLIAEEGVIFAHDCDREHDAGCYERHLGPWREVVKGPPDLAVYSKTMLPLTVQSQEASSLDPPCAHRLSRREDVPCSCPKGGRVIESYGCSVMGRCTTNSTFVATDKSVVPCRLCNVRLAPEDGKPLTWQVGVTTYLGRKTTTLPVTLTSLAHAGWENPRLSVDGGDYKDWQGCKYPLSVRPKTHAYGNWWLCVQELYVLNPLADRYLIVQDDVVFCKGLRDYLEKTPWPGRGYLNLFTWAENEKASEGRQGFYRATHGRIGLGALALVFDGDSIKALLSSEHMVEKFSPVDTTTGHAKKEPWRSAKIIDGGVAEALRQMPHGMSEWCHMPSLVQHQPGPSTLGHAAVIAPSFPKDPSFDARSLLK